MTTWRRSLGATRNGRTGWRDDRHAGDRYHRADPASGRTRATTPSRGRSTRRRTTSCRGRCGIGELARSLARAGLIDEFILLVHPLVLGSGQRLFELGLPTAALELTDARTSMTGVITATYRVRSTSGGDDR